MTLQKEESTTGTNDLLILGSGSAARKELLNSVGLVPDRVELPNVDESLRVKEKAPRVARKAVSLVASAARAMVAKVVESLEASQKAKAKASTAPAITAVNMVIAPKTAEILT